METIWISNGAKNDRAVVQGRVFLEKPNFVADSDSNSSSISGNTLLSVESGNAALFYTDLALGAGSQVDDVGKLNFAPQRLSGQTRLNGQNNKQSPLPEHTIGPANTNGHANTNDSANSNDPEETSVPENTIGPADSIDSAGEQHPQTVSPANSVQR